MPKYLVVPGFVISKNDGDRHWVSAQQLCRLYGVNPRECEVVTHPENYRGDDSPTVLRPRYDGDYRLDTPSEVFMTPEEPSALDREISNLRWRIEGLLEDVAAPTVTIPVRVALLRQLHSSLSAAQATIQAEREQCMDCGRIFVTRDKGDNARRTK